MVTEILPLITFIYACSILETFNRIIQTDTKLENMIVFIKINKTWKHHYCDLSSFNTIKTSLIAQNVALIAD